MMLLRLEEETEVGIRVIYASDEHIVLLREERAVFNGSTIYYLFLSSGASRRLTKASYESVLKILGWFDPASIQSQEVVVRGNLNLDILENPKKTTRKASKKSEGSV